MIPRYEQCLKLPSRMNRASGEHVVMEDEIRYDGHTYMGWCKFCGEVVYANHLRDYWHPVRPYYIQEDPV